MFEWDERKAAANLEKHQVSFSEAVTAFSDSDGLDGLDITHSIKETRFLRIAKSELGNALTIAYTERKDDDGQTKVRIISARPASRKERKAYESSSS